MMSNEKRPCAAVFIRLILSIYMKNSCLQNRRAFAVFATLLPGKQGGRNTLFMSAFSLSNEGKCGMIT